MYSIPYTRPQRYKSSVGIKVDPNLSSRYVCYDNLYHFSVFYYQNLFTCAMSDGDRMLGKYEAAPFINVQ